eukprot:14936280-Alexandrium_andersonii.AAC.1
MAISSDSNQAPRAPERNTQQTATWKACSLMRALAPWRRARDNVCVFRGGAPFVEFTLALGLREACRGLQ